MNRRDFFKLSVGGIATAAAVSREWPFKVFSFPTNVVIAKTADVQREARRVLDPIVSMSLNGNVAFFFSGKTRRPTLEEFDDFMRSPASLARDAYRVPEVDLARTYVREVKTKIVDEYGCEFNLNPGFLGSPGPQKNDVLEAFSKLKPEVAGNYETGQILRRSS